MEKMTYLQTSKRPSYFRNRAIYGVLIVLVVVTIFIHYMWPNFIPGFYNAIAQPFWRIEFARKLGAFNSNAELINQNEELHRQLQESEIRLASINMLEVENNELKKILGRTNDNSTTTNSKEVKTKGKTLAAVLERPPFALYDEIIIDQGKDAGFEIGDKVYAPGNLLIGKIVNVLSRTSKVRLFSSPDSEYQVLIGHNRIPATAFGRGGGQYEAELARDIKISEGDFVDAPSISDRTFGIVTTVISDPAEPFETIIFAPPLNIYELRWVLVDKQN